MLAEVKRGWQILDHVVRTGEDLQLNGMESGSIGY